VVDPDGDGWWRVGELTPAPGGEWWGVLFENPDMSIPSTLTWGFSFPFESLDEDGVAVPLGLTVEYVPLAAAGWRSLGGHRLTSTGFMGLAEANVHHYLHHRFESIDIDLAEQRGQLLRAVVIVSGDVDDLGIDPLHADAWLAFAGITVSLPDLTSSDHALARLAEFTDTSGLALPQGSAGRSFCFSPEPRS
jgi:hypothetical protein